MIWSDFFEKRKKFIIYGVNEVNSSHLSKVKEEMLVLGAPWIRAIHPDGYDHWYAIEGTHRLAAAY